MARLTRIALDAMGGDHGPPVIIPAAIKMLSAHPQLHIILVGDAATIKTQLKNYQNTRLTIRPTSQQIAMDESPALALRNKKDSSMRVAIDLVKSGVVEACVSAGNTGALMAIARFVLKTLPGIDRPAIMGRLPTTLGKSIRVLDLGANVDVKPENLLQFAIMGSIVANTIARIEKPKVALLNIGHEDIKGNELVKSTAVLFQKQQIFHYAGYIEADEIFQGKADIVVCDGFVGNVALKACEGMAKLIAHYFKSSFKESLFTKLAGLLALPILKALRRKMDPSEYNGASLLGLKGIVVKSHGSANVLGFSRAIEEAMLEVAHAVPIKIREQVMQYAHDL